MFEENGRWAGDPRSFAVGTYELMFPDRDTNRFVSGESQGEVHTLMAHEFAEVPGFVGERNANENFGTTPA